MNNKKQLAFWISMAISNAYAQENISENMPEQLSEVVVVGSIAPKSITETTSSVYYIDAETVERGATSGKTVSQIIAASAPSLNVSTEARTNFAQNMRGRRVLVMIDGVSLNSSRLVSRQFDSISPFNIDHIEVLSGATAVYGGNATGGIINIVTKKGKDGGLHGTTMLGITSGFNDGEDMDYTLSQSLSGGNEKIQGRIGLNLTQTKAFFDGSDNRIIPDVIQGSLQHNRSIDVTTGISMQPTEHQNIDISLQHYDSKQDNPYSYQYGPGLVGLSGVAAYADLIQPSEGFESDRQAQTKRNQFNISYSNDEVFGGQSFVGQFSYRDEDMSFIPFPKATGMRSMPVIFSASNQKTDVSTLRLALIKDLSPIKFTYGISASKESFEANQMLFDPQVSVASQGLINKSIGTVGRYPDVSIENLSVFSELEYQFTDKLTFDAGYRFEYLKNTVGDFISPTQQMAIALGVGKSADVIKGGSNDYKVHLFNVGARYDISDTQQTWVKFAQGFELPDPAKYYGVGNYSFDGSNWNLVNAVDANDNALTGVKTNSIELGWRWDSGDLSVQTAAYYAISDKKVGISNDGNLNIVVSDDKRRNFGLEGKADYALNDHWDIGGHFHFSRSEEKDSNGDWVKSPILYNNAPKLGAYIGYHNDKWSTRLNATSMLSLTGGDGNKYDGYTLFDLSSSYKIAGGNYGTLSLAVNNLFDKQYTTVWGQQAQLLYGNSVPDKLMDYKGRGRTFTLNYQYDF